MRRTTTVAILALALAACSGAGDVQVVEVRPFDEVQASEFVFELDPTNPILESYRTAAEGSDVPASDQ